MDSGLRGRARGGAVSGRTPAHAPVDRGGHGQVPARRHRGDRHPGAPAGGPGGDPGPESRRSRRGVPPHRSRSASTRPAHPPPHGTAERNADGHRTPADTGHGCGGASPGRTPSRLRAFRLGNRLDPAGHADGPLLGNRGGTALRTSAERAASARRACGSGRRRPASPGTNGDRGRPPLPRSSGREARVSGRRGDGRR